MKKIFSLVLLMLIINKISVCQTVKIGTQVWDSKNLDVTVFRNGDSIPEAKTSEEWEKAGKSKQPVWCYYNNDPSNGIIYGKLYNWYAVNDKRGLAPNGYHIPDNKEMIKLNTYLGGAQYAGIKMKSKNAWKDTTNNHEFNSSGFEGLPGGYRGSKGQFSDFGISGAWWTSTEHNSKNAYIHYLLDQWISEFSSKYNKSNGINIRCLRD